MKMETAGPPPKPYRRPSRPLNKRRLFFVWDPKTGLYYRDDCKTGPFPRTLNQDEADLYDLEFVLAHAKQTKHREATASQFLAWMGRRSQQGRKRGGK